MATETKPISSLVEEGQQAIVICLLAKNKHGDAILDSQLDLAIDTAKNVLQIGGAEVAASGSAIRFDPVNVGGVARITATLDTIIEGDPAQEETNAETPTVETVDDNDGEANGDDE